MAEPQAEQACVFCQIATGRQRAPIVDEAETWTSFPPLDPHVSGHLLFIPRRHVRDATAEPALTGTVFAAASAYLGRVLKSEGNLLTSVGKGASQTVMHLHVHVIPRRPGDGLHHDWPWMRGDSTACLQDNGYLGPRCEGCAGCPSLAVLPVADSRTPPEQRIHERPGTDV